MSYFPPIIYVHVVCKYDELGNALQKPVFDVHTSVALTLCSTAFLSFKRSSALGRALSGLDPASM